MLLEFKQTLIIIENTNIMKILATSQMATVKANGLCNLLSGIWKEACLFYKRTSML